MTQVKLGAGVLVLVLASACSRGPRPIVVGSKSSTEQTILAEIAAQLIERRLGVPVERRIELGDTLVAHEALLTGSIDLYPEYTGTALVLVLKAPFSVDTASVRERVKDEYQAQFRLEWLPPLGFRRSFVMAVRAADARQNPLETLSDAAASDKAWRLGISREFQGSADGLTLLMTTYRLERAAAPKTMDARLLYKSLRQKEVDMVPGVSTDPFAAWADIKPLKDDKGVFPAYDAAFVVRSDTRGQWPQLHETLGTLSGKFTDEIMRRLNREIDVDKKPVAVVAADFLHRAGLY